MGLIRVFLAGSVVLAHMRVSGPGIDGYVAVLMFFAISGFYMSMVLNEKYDSVLPFYIARYLRLWPCYAVVMIGFSIFLREPVFFGEPIVDLYLWFVRITMIAFETLNWFGFRPDQGLIWLDSMRGSFIDGKRVGAVISHVGMAHMWSIGVELVFYACAPLVARSFPRLLVAFVVAYIAHLVLVNALGPLHPLVRYSAFSFIWIFFAGMISFWAWRSVRDRFTDRLPPYWIAAPLGLAFAIGSMLAIRAGRGSPVDDVALVAFALSIGPIFAATARTKWDRQVGELSYPLYVVHYPLTSIVFREFKGEWSAAFGVLALSLALAVVLYTLVDRPSDRIRHRLSALQRRERGNFRASRS